MSQKHKGLSKREVKYAVIFLDFAVNGLKELFLSSILTRCHKTKKVIVFHFDSGIKKLIGFYIKNTKAKPLINWDKNEKVYKYNYS